MTKNAHDILLHKIYKRLDNLTSFKQTFFRGVVAGLGSALGATIILALVIGILLRIIQTAEKIPFLGEVVEKIDFEKVVNPSPSNN